MSESVVLDSFALVSLLHREPGWKRVQAALQGRPTRCTSWNSFLSS